MLLNNFSGGLLLRPNRDKVKPLYGTTYNNIDHERGSLIPIKVPQPLGYTDNKGYCNSVEVEGNTQTFKEVTTTTIYPKLGWTEAPLDNTDSCNYQQAYSYIYTMYNPLTQEETHSSNVIYGTSNSATDITVYPKIDVDAWDAGYTKIRLYRRTVVSSSEKAEIMDEYEAGRVHYVQVAEVDVNRDDGNAEIQDTTNPTGGSGDYVDTPKIPYADTAFKDMGGDTEPEPQTTWLKGTNQHAIVFVSDTDSCNKESDIPYAISIAKDEGETYGCHIILTVSPPTAGKFYINDCGKYRLLQTIPAGGTKIDTPDYADYNAIMPLPCDREEPLVVETLADVEVTGSYTSPSCDDLITTPESEQVFTYANIAKDFIFHSTRGWVVDFKGVTYVFDKDTNYLIDPNKIDSGLMTIGLPIPIATMTSGNAGDDIHYRFTFYNSVHDIESPASDPISFSGEVDVNAQIHIDNTDVVADTIRVYRLNDGLINYTLERIIDIADISDFSIGVAIDKLESIAGEPVLLSVEDTAPFLDMQFVTATNSIIVGAIDDKMYFCKEGDPTTWAREDYIDFDTEITGIGAIRSGIIVFTLTDTYIVVGSRPTTFAKYLITKEVGCIHGRTVQPYNGGLLFASFDGIYFTNGGRVINFTEKRLSRMHLVPELIINATVANNMYHIALTTDAIFERDRYYNPLLQPFLLVLDYRFNKMIRTISEDVQWLGQKDRMIIFEKPTKVLYELYPIMPTYRELHYVSPFLDSSEYSRLKHYNDFYISYEPPMHLKITLKSPTVANEDRIIYDKQLPDDKLQHNLSSLAHVDGYAIILEFRGSGKVHEVAYKSKGRAK